MSSPESNVGRWGQHPQLMKSLSALWLPSNQDPVSKLPHGTNSYQEPPNTGRDKQHSISPKERDLTLQCPLLTKHYDARGHSPGHERSPAPLCPQDPADLGCHHLMPHKASLPHKDWTWCLRENLLALSEIHTKPTDIKVRVKVKILIQQSPPGPHCQFL